MVSLVQCISPCISASFSQGVMENTAMTLTELPNDTNVPNCNIPNCATVTIIMSLMALGPLL